jgi:hypothetical protein
MIWCLMQNAGADLIVGDAWIDLEKAKVRKATKLRFTHGQIYANNYGGGGSTYLQMWETPLNIQPVVIYGYSGMCPNANNCPVPAGFRAVGDSAC